MAFFSKTNKNLSKKTMNNKKYIATFVLDTRGYDQPVETLIEKLKGVIEAVGGKVESAENKGVRNLPARRIASL